MFCLCVHIYPLRRTDNISMTAKSPSHIRYYQLIFNLASWFKSHQHFSSINNTKDLQSGFALIVAAEWLDLLSTCGPRNGDKRDRGASGCVRGEGWVRAMGTKQTTHGAHLSYLISQVINLDLHKGCQAEVREQLQVKWKAGALMDSGEEVTREEQWALETEEVSETQSLPVLLSNTSWGQVWALRAAEDHAHLGVYLSKPPPLQALKG